MRRRDVLGAAVGAAVRSVAPRATRTEAHRGYGPLGRVAVPGAREAVVDAAGETAYVAATDGFATVDLSDPASPTVLAERRGLLAEREGGPLRGIQDVKLDGDRLVVAGPAHPSDERQPAGFLVYDVADPATPERLAFFETDYPVHNCFARDGYVYLAGTREDGNPLVVVDHRDDDPAEVARWSVLDEDDRWADVTRALWPLHDVWVQDELAYLAHWDAGTWIVDVSDPTAPAAVAAVGGRSPAALTDLKADERRAEAIQRPGNDHYATLDESGTVLGVGVEAWNATSDGGPGPGGITFYDVSDPEAPARLSRIPPPETPDPTLDGVWTTAHNFDLQAGRCYSSWYRGGVTVHDVRDPETPAALTSWRADDASFWTAQAAVPGECFVASAIGTLDDGTGALYAFPDEAGAQIDRSRPGTKPAAGTWPTTTATGQSGVGAGLALLALLVAAWRAARRGD